MSNWVVIFLEADLKSCYLIKLNISVFNLFNTVLLEVRQSFLYSGGTKYFPFFVYSHTDIQISYM